MFRSGRGRALVIPVAFALAVAAPGRAAAQTFNFESVAATGNSGAHTSLVMTDGGITVTLYRSSGLGFDIVHNTGIEAGKPSGWGLRTLSPFFNSTANDWFIANFSVPVESAKIQLGDYGGDSDIAFIQAWSGLNATGVMVNADADTYGTSTFPVKHYLSAASTSFRSIAFGGGSTGFANSLYWDKLELVEATAVPEPGSLVLFGAGLPVLGLLIRRRKNRV